jgi:hypothetical protein
MRFFRRDAWSALHLTGCFALTRLFSHIPFPIEPLWFAAIIAFVLGIAWEIVIDEWRLIPDLCPDLRGADGTDLIFDLTGCLAAATGV